MSGVKLDRWLKDVSKLFHLHLAEEFNRHANTELFYCSSNPLNIPTSFMRRVSWTSKLKTLCGELGEIENTIPSLWKHVPIIGKRFNRIGILTECFGPTPALLGFVQMVYKGVRATVSPERPTVGKRKGLGFVLEVDVVFFNATECDDMGITYACKPD